ncbi:MAG TPA: hypothetical protein VIV14_10610 [Gammaproteobacteria bacterium]
MTVRRRLTPMLSVVALVLFTAACDPGLASAAASDRSPEDTVRKYLAAMQEHRFTEAYDYVSSTLRGGKDREEWAKEQQYIVQIGEVKIFGYKVYTAEVVDEQAKVPNILKSQDKYLNQLGLDEHEIYMLIKEDGEWRIDQQTLVEGPERSEYFPDE